MLLIEGSLAESYGPMRCSAVIEKADFEYSDHLIGQLAKEQRCQFQIPEELILLQLRFVRNCHGKRCVSLDLFFLLASIS
jgi:hypothetical protein